MGEQRQDKLRARQRRGPKQQVDVSAEPATRHEHEPLTPLGELVGELEGDPAAERVSDDTRALDVESHQQVANARRMRPERVIAPRLGRLAVPEQIRRDNRMPGGQHAGHVVPLRRAARNPVNQHDGRSLTRDAEVHAMPMEGDLDPLDVL